MSQSWFGGLRLMSFSGIFTDMCGVKLARTLSSSKLMSLSGIFTDMCEVTLARTLRFGGLASTRMLGIRGGFGCRTFCLGGSFVSRTLHFGGRFGSRALLGLQGVFLSLITMNNSSPTHASWPHLFLNEESSS